MTTWNRRDVLCAAFATAMASSWSTANTSTAAGEETDVHLGPARPFSFEKLAQRARRLADENYRPRPSPAPSVVQRIDYDAHGAIQYRRDLALFADGSSTFPVTFFHLGKFFSKPVRMHVVRGDEAREVRYARRYFEMPANSPAREMPPDAGFAGFRLHESHRRDDWKTQDWVAFLGASYFRAIGALGQYGLSARGITVDTATSTSEEFPDFVEFYIAPAATERGPVTVFALLDGPSISGAYRFDIRRTAGVVMDVEKRLFFRAPVTRVGIAPLTSMFWYGEHNRPYRVDWRPEVHDSDGLALWTGTGERIWRPLNNPPQVRASSFADRNPRGFGLFQRDRAFAHYLDGVHYERRPSLWVEPLDDWGEGAVELIELPTDDEIHDNIVAAWRPAEPAQAGTAMRFRYRLHWLAEHPYPGAVARCVATRIGRGGEPGTPRPAGVSKFVVEFEGQLLEELGPYAEPVAIVSASRGRISGIRAERVPGTPRWRGVFDLAVNGDSPVELRLYLRQDDRVLTETWLYQHLPASTP